MYSKKRIYASIPATHVAAFQNVDPRDWHVAYVGLFHRFSRILSRYLFKFVTFLFFSPSRQIISSRVEKFGRSCFFFFVITSVSPLFLSLLHFFSFSKFCDSFNYTALFSYSPSRNVDSILRINKCFRLYIETGMMASFFLVKSRFLFLFFFTKDRLV